MRKIKPKQDEYAISSSVKGSMGRKKDPPVYPKFRVDLEHLPEAKNMKLGDKAKVSMHAKLVGLSQSRFDNSAEFEIHGIEHNPIVKGGKADETDGN